VANLGGVGDHLGRDVARAGERVVGRRDARLGRDERRGLGRRIAVGGLRQDPLRQRLEPLVARGLRPRPAPRPVRRVEVLERALGVGRAQPRLELGGELALLRDRREDRGAPGLELDQVRAALLDGPDLDLVEPAGRLLAVARDERDGVAVTEQADHGRDAGGRQLELGRQPRHRIEAGQRGRRGSVVVGDGSAFRRVGHEPRDRIRDPGPAQATHSAGAAPGCKSALETAQTDLYWYSRPRSFLAAGEAPRLIGEE
jgi:hypothetical protein